MFHKAIDIKCKPGTTLEVTFQDGAVKSFDMARLFEKHPQLAALKNRALFEQAELVGAYGIRWTDELDIETATIYEEGETVRMVRPANAMVGDAVAAARANAGMTQKELARISRIDQSDISRIERGVANPSIATLSRIAAALGADLHISIA